MELLTPRSLLGTQEAVPRKVSTISHSPVLGKRRVRSGNCFTVSSSNSAVGLDVDMDVDVVVDFPNPLSVLRHSGSRSWFLLHVLRGAFVQTSPSPNFDGLFDIQCAPLPEKNDRTHRLGINE